MAKMAKRKKTTPGRRSRKKNDGNTRARRRERDRFAPPEDHLAPSRARDLAPSALWFPVAVAILLAAFVVVLTHGPIALAGRKGDEIVVQGKMRSIGVPVVLWSDPGGYDAYQKCCRDHPDRVLPMHPAPGCNTPERLGKRTGAGDLAERVTQFVVHYDEAWTSKNCFHVLQDERGLSVQFMCDLDGTIYQTCDCQERARQARDANDRSVGCEIAHPGALEGDKTLASHYKRDEQGLFLELPKSLGPDFVRTKSFVARPARPEPVKGKIHSAVQTQYDFTNEQYKAMAHLVAGVAKALPKIALDAPRDPATGKVLEKAMDPKEAAAFHGIVGHFHLQTDKLDPGPAFDWERLLREAKAVK
jgi:N-acetyl-anhydromuramyl-L-alanine amidase AmpD